MRLPYKFSLQRFIFLYLCGLISNVLFMSFKSFFGISISITIYLIFIVFLGGIDTSLNQLDVVSIATFSNYSITKLVYTFYTLVFGGLCFLVLTTILLSILYNKSAHFRNIAKTLNPFGYLSFLVVLFSLAITKNQDVVHFYMMISGLFIIHYFIISRIENSEKNLNNLFYYMLFLSLSAVIGLKDFLFIFKIKEFSIFITFPILFLIFSLIIYFISKKISISKIFLISLPLLFLPLLSFLKTELFLIFNQHGISLHSPKLLWICGEILILISIIILVFKGKSKKSIGKTLYYVIFPVFMTGIICWMYYNPFFTINDDLFENANPVNAIFRSIEYQEIPFIDYLTSHAMSDTFFGFCYVLLNGYSGFCDFFMYDFLYNAIFFIIIYHFLLKVLGKTPLLFFISFFFPFLSLIFYKGLVFSLVLIFLWYKFFNHQRFKYLMLIYLATILAVFWRFDLGFPCVFISTVFSLCWLFTDFSKEKLFLFFKAFAVVASFFGILATIFLIKDTENFIQNFLQAKSYLTANQAHALEKFASNDQKANFIHLILYPAIAVSMLFGLIYSYTTRKINSNNKFLWLSAIFLILFYFLNFQRGLVRHSLFAGTSNFTTTFFYLSFALFLLFILPKYLQKLKNHIFILSITIPVFFTALPFPDDGQDYLCVILEKYGQDEENLSSISSKTNRVINQTEYENTYFKDLKIFFDDNFSKDETFLDFSNTPMLYFNLKRQVPSYFCQYMQNTVTSFLQEENLKLIRKSNVPVVIFSNEPNNWFDFTDGVPNTLRYNVICKYIYENYTPLTIISKHSIWIKKDLQEKFENYDNNTFAYDMKNYHLRKYPYLLGKYDTAAYNNLHEISMNKSNHYEKVEIPQNVDFQNSALIIKVLKSEKNTNAKLIYYYRHIVKGIINFDIQQSDKENIYIIPIDYQYNWYSGIADNITLEADISYDNNISISFSLKQ